MKVTKDGPDTFLVSQPRRELNVAVPLLKMGQVPVILATCADVQQDRVQRQSHCVASYLDTLLTHHASL